jgi:HSP20 family molecular chaperone IbpA
MANENPTHELQARRKPTLPGEGTRPGPLFRPDLDIVERRDAFVVYADLPGADEKSVQVRLDQGTLTLDAQLATLPDPSWTPLHAEYRFGGYHRELRISDDIDARGVTASMRNGVLELLLPKSAELQPRTIAVQPG